MDWDAVAQHKKCFGPQIVSGGVGVCMAQWRP